MRRFALAFPALAIFLAAAQPASSVTPAIDPAGQPAPTTQPSGRQCLSDGFAALQSGKNEEAMIAVQRGIKSFGPLPVQLSDPTSIDLFDAAAVASLRLGDMSSAKRFMDRVIASGRSDRSVTLNAATIEIKIKNYNVHAVEILDAFCTGHPTDNPAMDLFGVAIDRAASVRVNSTALAPHIASYLQLNTHLEATRPGFRRWGTEWIGSADYAAKSETRDLATRECDDEKRSLSKAQANLQTQRDGLSRAEAQQVFGSRRPANTNNSGNSDDLNNSIDAAQQRVDDVQRRVDDASSRIPPMPWNCNLLGIMPEGIVVSTVATSSAAIPTSVASAKPSGIAFVVDTAGSMLTELAAVKLQMGEAINNLPPDRNFGIFAQTNEKTIGLSQGLIAATDADKSKAAVFIAALTARGPTDLDQALNAAATFHPITIWLLTDGDIQNTQHLWQVVHHLPPETRVNTVIFSPFPKNDEKQLLLQIAADTNGVCVDQSGKRLPLPPKSNQPLLPPSLPKGQSIFDSQ